MIKYTNKKCSGEQYSDVLSHQNFEWFVEKMLCYYVIEIYINIKIGIQCTHFYLFVFKMYISPFLYTS